jgi:hypothetical protein
VPSCTNAHIPFQTPSRRPSRRQSKAWQIHSCTTITEPLHLAAGHTSSTLQAPHYSSLPATARSHLTLCKDNIRFTRLGYFHYSIRWSYRAVDGRSASQTSHVLRRVRVGWKEEGGEEKEKKRRRSSVQGSMSVVVSTPVWQNKKEKEKEVSDQSTCRTRRSETRRPVPKTDEGPSQLFKRLPAVVPGRPIPGLSIHAPPTPAPQRTQLSSSTLVWCTVLFTNPTISVSVLGAYARQKRVDRPSSDTHYTDARPLPSSG